MLRELYEAGRVNAAGWAWYVGGAGAQETAQAAPDHDDGHSYASWEFYAEAAEEAVPAYKVELAKSGRSECVKKPTAAACKHGGDPVIAKGEIRCGSMDMEAGSYGRWHHLRCWRVPASIWLGLPGEDCRDPAKFEAAIQAMQQLAFCGFTELSPEDRAQVVSHLMDRENYARRTVKSQAKVPYGSAGAAAAGPAGAAAASPPSKAVVVAGSGGLFIAPRPGVNGAVAGALTGQTFVMTGTFPELGGGAGLDLGKTKCKAMVEAFGGRVTSAVSGVTSYLIVGKAPGASKVSHAKAKGVPTLDIQGLKRVLETPGAALQDAPAATIGAFSTGYRGNGIGYLIEMGEAPPACIKPPPKAKAAKAKPPPRPKAEEPEAAVPEEEEVEIVAVARPKRKAAAGATRSQPKRGKRGGDEE